MLVRHAREVGLRVEREFSLAAGRLRAGARRRRVERLLGRQVVDPPAHLELAGVEDDPALLPALLEQRLEEEVRRAVSDEITRISEDHQLPR